MIARGIAVGSFSRTFSTYHQVFEHVNAGLAAPKALFYPSSPYCLWVKDVINCTIAPETMN
jgi:hypothetical protein